MPPHYADCHASAKDNTTTALDATARSILHLSPGTDRHALMATCSMRLALSGRTSCLGECRPVLATGLLNRATASVARPTSPALSCGVTARIKSYFRIPRSKSLHHQDDGPGRGLSCATIYHCLSRVEKARSALPRSHLTWRLDHNDLPLLQTR